MVMLKTISLSNFESHVHTVVRFDANMTMFTGTSEHGKSAILRALYWVAFNRPSGDEFRRFGTKLTKVEVTTDTLKITREKGDKLNRYTLEYLKDNSKMHFNGFGQSVPEEIKKALNLKDINFKTQFDDNFLLPPISSGEVARQINQFVDLDVIDRALANINAEYKGLNKQIEDHKANAKALSDEIETKYKNLENAENDLVKLEKLKLKLEKVIERGMKLQSIENHRARLEESLLQYADLPTKTKYIQAFDRLLNERGKVVQSKEKLVSMYEKYILLKERLGKYHHAKQKASSLERIELLAKDCNEYRKHVSRLTALYESYKEHRKNIEKYTKSISEKEKEIEKVMPKGSKCLLCGSIIV